jgi:hypothetical protein
MFWDLGIYSDFYTHTELSDCFLARLQNFEKRLLASSCFSFHLSVRMEKLCSHWTNFDQILNLEFFRKSVETIEVPLKSEKNNGYVT